MSEIDIPLPKRFVRAHPQQEYLDIIEDNGCLPMQKYNIQAGQYDIITAIFNQHVHQAFNTNDRRKIRFMPCKSFGQAPPKSIIKNYDCLIYILHNPHRKEPDIYFVVAYYGEHKISYKPNHQSGHYFQGEEVEDTILQGINIFTLHNLREYARLPKWMVRGVKSLNVCPQYGYENIKWCFIHVRLDFKDNPEVDVSDDIFSIGTMYEAACRHINRYNPFRGVFTIIPESVVKWKWDKTTLTSLYANMTDEYKRTFRDVNYYNFSRSDGDGRSPVYPCQHIVRFRPHRFTTSSLDHTTSTNSDCIVFTEDIMKEMLSSMVTYFASFMMPIRVEPFIQFEAHHDDPADQISDVRGCIHIQPIAFRGHMFFIVFSSSDVVHPVTNVTFFICDPHFILGPEDSDYLRKIVSARYNFGYGYTFNNKMFGRHAYELGIKCDQSPWQALGSALHSLPICPYAIPGDFALVKEFYNRPISCTYLIEEVANTKKRFYVGFTKEELMQLQVANSVIASIEGEEVTNIIDVEDGESIRGSQVLHAYPLNIAATINLNDSTSSGFSEVLRQSKEISNVDRPFKPPAFIQDEYATIKDFGFYIYNQLSDVQVPSIGLLPSRSGFKVDIVSVVSFWISNAMESARSYSSVLKKKGKYFYRPSYSIVRTAPIFTRSSTGKDIIFTVLTDGGVVILLSRSGRLLYCNGNSYTNRLDDGGTSVTYRPLVCFNERELYEDFNMVADGFNMSRDKQFSLKGVPSRFHDDISRFHDASKIPLELCSRYGKPQADVSGVGYISDLFMIAYLLNFQPEKAKLRSFPLCIPSTCDFDRSIKAYVISLLAKFGDEDTDLTSLGPESIYYDYYSCSCSSIAEFSSADDYVAHIASCSR